MIFALVEKGLKMPRWNVIYPDGTWNVWSTVVDNWLFDEPITFDELAEFRRNEALQKANEENISLLTSKPQVNKMSYDMWRDSFAWVLEAREHYENM